ncbi:hypothetical protein NDU88_002111 [Pleurodeles waltl]|uniref:Uncharacterized protein n=1 Tax=Pleurodeles waltl TaxID=8319 RepID=A0AAV7QBR0_PLEWA|nr:hypothetical protein NDU88_002111 [Pleurodeles waltl]
MCRSFIEVKKALRDHEIKSSMIFLTKVVTGDKTLYFETHEETWDWLEGWTKVAGPKTKIRMERQTIH